MVKFIQVNHFIVSFSFFASDRIIHSTKGIPALIELLSDSRELAVANAACVLTNMAPEESLRADILAMNILEALVEPLKSK